MKLRAEKHQHVPERYWFLMDVIGSSLMVSNWYSGASFFSWAFAPKAIARAAIETVMVLRFIAVIEIVDNS